MRASERKLLKRAQIKVTRLGLGTAPFGGLYAPVASSDAVATIETAFEAGIRYFDTAPMYGLGRSELILGSVLRKRDHTSARITTKVGRLLAAGRPGRPLPPEPPKNEFDAGWSSALSFRKIFDHSYDAVMRSFEDSQQRLGLARLDLLYIHDISRVAHGERHDVH